MSPKDVMIVENLANFDFSQPHSFAGWDTDQFLTDPTEAALVGLAIIRNVRAGLLSKKILQILKP